MMNRNLYLIFTLILLIFVSCAEPEEEYVPPEMVREITPALDGESYNDSYFSINSLNAGENQPLIALNENEVLIYTLNLNLDLDSQEEQILVMKKRDNPEGYIKIAVANYDNVKGGYLRAWEAETRAENIRSFDIHLEDLVGDHNSEIICAGRNNDGLTTLDVFRKNTMNSRQLDYKLIFSKTVKGNIDINQIERSRAYLQGLKDGDSFTITVTIERKSEDSEDENSFDLIISKYYWDFPQREYLLLEEEVVQNDFVAEKQLESILSADESAFYEFIEGPWKFENLIAYFEPDRQTATFYTERIQENYSWINSYKVLSNLLYIRGKNEIINYIENEIYVRIVDLNRISITVRDINSQTHTKESNEIWTNIYTRMLKDERELTLKKLETVLNDEELPLLSGQYISDSGDIFEFYGNDFYKRSSAEEISGGYAVFKADKTILSLKVIDENGIVTEERSFSLEYSEEQKEKFIQRTIIMRPGLLSIYGFHSSGTGFYRYTQIETLDISASEEDQ